jgi:hypothetical protein
MKMKKVPVKKAVAKKTAVKGMKKMSVSKGKDMKTMSPQDKFKAMIAAKKKK